MSALLGDARMQRALPQQSRAARPCPTAFVAQAARPHGTAPRPLAPGLLHTSRSTSPCITRTSAAVVDAPQTSQTAVPQPSDTVDWYDNWYPVAFARHIDKEHPYRFVLMEIPLVIWWDKNREEFRAFNDSCPHRLVPLSEGRINGKGELECGYHGWTFDGAGKCTAIPQVGDNKSRRACAVAFPIVDRQGLLFVKPIPYNGGEDYPVDESTIPLVQELEGQTDWIAQDTFRDLPYDWATLLENVVDASHVPFTHHVTISNRYEIGTYDIERTSPITKEGFRGVWKTGPRAGKLGSQFAWFRAPAYFQNKLSALPRGYEAMLIVYGTPMGPGKCRLFNRNLFNFTSPVPRAVFRVFPEWLNHINSHIPLEDDQVFLHLGEETFNKATAGGRTASQACYMPSTADTLVIAFRQWAAKYGGGGPFGDTTTPEYAARLEPRQSKQQLLDRYTQHTQHCTICQAALSRFRALKATATALSAALLTAALLTAAAALAGGGPPAPLPLSPVENVHCLMSLWLAARHAVVCGLLGAGAAVVGAGPPDAMVLRAVGWVAAAAVAWGVRGVLGMFEAKFITGVYPPPRNLAKDPA